MNIAFWAPQGGDAAAGLCALLAASAALRFPCRTVVLDNYLAAKNLGSLLLGERFEEIRQSYRQFQADIKRGDTFLQFLSRETGKRIRGRKALEIIPDGLFFCPMNQSLPKDVFEYGFMEELPDLFEYCAETFDASFWNLEANRNFTTPWLLEQADKVVVLLPGSWEAFQKFFEDYKSLLHKSLIVLQEQPFMTLSMASLIRRIRKKYALPKEQLYGWCASANLQCALAEGKTVEYLCKYFHAAKLSPEYEGMRCIYQLTAMLLQKERKQQPHSYPELGAPLMARRKSSSPASALTRDRAEGEELWVAE